MLLNSLFLLQRLTESSPVGTEPNEARSRAMWLIAEYFGIAQSAIMAGKDLELSREIFDNWLSDFRRNRPVQYLLGYTWFYNFKIKVNEKVLIPRPETEELVSIIVEKHPSAQRIIDWCTGSGCIGLAIKSGIPEAEVMGYDLSEEAIEVAKRNAFDLSLEVEFQTKDVLKDWPPLAQPDLIVSNPPYVCESEAQDMESNVLDFEPHLALFVPDVDPLLFYRHLFEKGYAELKKGGSLYAEINPHYAKHILILAKSKPWAEVTLMKDFQGKERFIQLKR